MGKFGLGDTTQIGPKKMTKELLDAGSSPEFFDIPEEYWPNE